MRTRQDFVLFTGAIIILFNACSNGSRTQRLEMSKTEIEEEGGEGEDVDQAE